MTDEQEYTKVALIVVAVAILGSLGGLLLANHAVRQTAAALEAEVAPTEQENVT